MAILIEVAMDRMGCVTATPVNERVRRKYAKHMLQYTGHADGSAFFQGDWEVPEEITSHRDWNDVERGWPVRMLVDPWLFGHWLGYDACNVRL